MCTFKLNEYSHFIHILFSIDIPTLHHLGKGNVDINSISIDIYTSQNSPSTVIVLNKKLYLFISKIVRLIIEQLEWNSTYNNQNITSN